MGRHEPRRRTFCLLLGVFLAALPPGPAQADPVYGAMWFLHMPTSHPSRLSRLFVERFDLGITDREPRGQATIKGLNPEFDWFVLNSITDTWVPPRPAPDDRRAEEYQALLRLAGEAALDPEIAYLHYAEDTRVSLGADTLLIRGWPRGSARKAAEARIPIHDRTRYLVHFATPGARQLHKELLIHLALGAPFRDSHVYPDGIFLDDASAKLSGFGTILSGGAVEEAGGLRIQTPAFQDWQWKKNLGPFLAALKDTLETSAVWSRDHSPKRLMINVAADWDDSYIYMDVAHVLFLESQYNPLRNAGRGAVDEAYRRDRSAADAGIVLAYAPAADTTVQGHQGERTMDEVLLGNLAWYFVSRTERSIYFALRRATPGAAGRYTSIWEGSFETAAERLGDPQGPPFTLAEGTDPAGNPYVVKARRYQDGLAVIRNRGEESQDFGPETRAVIHLRDPMSPILPSGKIGAVVSTIALRNGEGILLLGGR